MKARVLEMTRRRFVLGSAAGTVASLAYERQSDASPPRFNGVGDATAAIQKLLDHAYAHGYTAVLPRGNYSISRAIHVRGRFECVWCNMIGPSYDDAKIVFHNGCSARLECGMFVNVELLIT